MQKKRKKLSHCPIMEIPASIVLEAELLANGNGTDKWIWLSRSPICNISSCEHYDNCPILKGKADIYMKI